jgi:hypothetical protein
MAIRIRVVDGVTVALCAARSIAKPGDIYLDDAVHEALSNKFSRDYNEMFDANLPGVLDDSALVEQEESNNPNRDEWDKAFNKVQ